MASKRAQRRRACESKTAYPDEPAAKAALRALLRNKPNGPAGLHAYACPFGNHWHYGHKPKGPARKRKKREA